MPDGSKGWRSFFIRANHVLGESARSNAAASILELSPKQTDFSALEGHKYVLLVTYKRDGGAVTTPVWFGKDGDRIFIWTEENSFKVKRIRRSERAMVAPCGPRGEPLGDPILAQAHLVKDQAQRKAAAKVILREWGFFRRGFERISRILTDVEYIEIKPA